MLVKIGNHPREYDWGSKTLLADALGIEATGREMAELWFGTHPISEAFAVESNLPLSNLLGTRFGLMAKFLAAEHPLSIQLHPNAKQAEAGFAAENGAGLDLADAARTFRDDKAKREAIVAITEFELLAGLLPAAQIAKVLEELGERVSEGSAALLARYSALLLSADGHRAMLGDILAGDQPSELQAGLLGELVELAQTNQEFRFVDAALLHRLASRFGADRGLLLALTMQRFTLEPGAAMFVETGVPHCYLNGLGVEVMTSSDNVLRGGLTHKHVSTSDFMAMLDVAEALKTSTTVARQLGVGLWRYDFAADEFVVHRLSVSGSNMLIDFGLPGASILMCLSGELAVSNSLEERLVLRRGEVAYLSDDARFYSITGSGDGLLASATA